MSYAAVIFIIGLLIAIHEFGHALHSMLQNVRYRGLADTPRDYVELPSQLNERWLLSREVLEAFARLRRDHDGHRAVAQRHHRLLEAAHHQVQLVPERDGRVVVPCARSRRCCRRRCAG